MGQFGAVVGPDTLAPGAVAAGLGGQQLEPRPSVAGSSAGTLGRDLLVDQPAGPPWAQHLVVATDPGQLTGPAATPWCGDGCPASRGWSRRSASRSGPSPGPAAARWGAGPAAGITASSPGWVPLATSCSRYWVRFRVGVWEPEQSRTTRRELGGLVIIPPGSGHRRSGDQRRPPHGRPAASGCGPWPGGGVQLADQLGVAALGLDRGQPVRQGGPLPRPTLRGAPCVLLDQQPLVAAVLQA
jgi:hypothetical protein